MDKIKEITGIEKFNDAKILIDTDDKLPDNITLENVIMWTTFVIKDGDEFHRELFSEETLYDK